MKSSLQVFVAVCLLMVQTAFSQTITLSFTGCTNHREYVQLDSVRVENLTRNWTEKLIYPDTVLILDDQTSVSEVTGDVAKCISYPNPFHGTSRVVLTLPQSGQVTLFVYNMQGQQVMEKCVQVEAGESDFEISLDHPQVYFLIVHTVHGKLVQKLINTGHAGGNSIVYMGTQNHMPSKTRKLHSSKPFQRGDILKVNGYVTFDGEVIVNDDMIQEQWVDESYTLYFILQDKDIPVVVTDTVTSIMDSSAVGGGNVINDGKAPVTARGICWDTLPAPTISGKHTVNGSGLGVFISNMTGLTPGTTYYVRAYATNSEGTAYGNEVTFTTATKIIHVIFSVSATDSVEFSPGNLQWSATNGGAAPTTHTVAGNGRAAGTWRFAPNQWDTIGIGNRKISSTYTGWIDLFGWGTSGYHYSLDTNNVYYQPYSRGYYTPVIDTIFNYYGYGPSLNMQDTHLIGTSANYDWGVYNAVYNPRTNSTDAPGTWRTLTQLEWSYLLETRSTASGVRFAKATVNGVAGIIIVPDNWSQAVYTLDSVNTGTVSFATNVITAAQWVSVLENAGCVFLPAAGSRSGSSVFNVSTIGVYWASTGFGCNTGHNINFQETVCRFQYFHGNARYYGHSVRLVRSLGTPAPELPIVITDTVSNITDTTAVCGGNVINEGGVAVTARGICWDTIPNPTISGKHTVNGGGVGKFTSNMTGLTYSTTYYVRAYATNSVGTAYGNQITFTTKAVLPTIITDTVSNITDTTAVGGGNVTNDGGAPITVRGICWDTISNPTISGRHTINGRGMGRFTSNITGLKPNTTYYVRAYATNSVGTAYGNLIIFATKAGLPTIITDTVGNITDTTAVGGGNVLNDGGDPVTARGICWDTLPAPTVSGKHIVNGSGLGRFTSNITGLKPGTTYYVRAYATNKFGTAYGNEVSFTTISNIKRAVFSVSATDSVEFSPGNLQWSATNGGNTPTTHVVAGNGTAAGTWRFAPNQWDTIGANNSNVSSTYTGWIDLFGWGTSGWNNGNYFYQPYSTSSSTSAPYTSTIGNGYGPTDGSIYSYSLTGAYANSDWGVYNAIYNPRTNSTDAPGTWRTPTSNEWNYLLFNRNTASGIRYAKATVNGVTGLIIVPDNWNASTYALNSTNMGTVAFTSNIILAANWTTLENAGAIFLPAAGSRLGTYANTADRGYYWSVTCLASNGANAMVVISSNVHGYNGGNRYTGRSVRLVRSVSTPAPGLPIVITDTISNLTDTTAVGGGNVINDGGVPVNVRGICWDTIPYPTINKNNTVNGSGTGSFTSNISGLKPGTTYYVRAYATNSVGTAYGNEVSFTAISNIKRAVFSVSATDSVEFSPGNLQWSATNGGNTPTTHVVAGNGTAAGTWRFSPNQWDTIGANNNNISSSYTGWIDLFGWGTSGWNNGNYFYQPYSTSSSTSAPYTNAVGNGYGPTDGSIYSYSLTGIYANSDWGVYNAIYNPKTNTTDAPGTWRTPTSNEWNYLLCNRNTASGIRYAKATVNGVTGLIVVPDNWNASTYALDSTNMGSVAFTSNVISAAKWTVLEKAGAIFLPAAGDRLGTYTLTSDRGYYWSVTCYDDHSAYSIVVIRTNVQCWGSGGNRFTAKSVRLVKDVK